MSEYSPDKIKKQVRKRAKGYCEYCYSSTSFSPTGFDIDHILPVSLGGNSTLKNLALACGECNGHKHIKTHYFDPITLEKTRLFHPRNDYWLDHFQWNEDESLIVGLTAVGRTTVDLLEVNREGNVNLRFLLQLVGLHPPKSYIKS